MSARGERAKQLARSPWPRQRSRTLKNSVTESPEIGCTTFLAALCASVFQQPPAVTAAEPSRRSKSPV